MYDPVSAILKKMFVSQSNVMHMKTNFANYTGTHLKGHLNNQDNLNNQTTLSYDISFMNLRPLFSVPKVV